MGAAPGNDRVEGGQQGGLHSRLWTKTGLVPLGCVPSPGRVRLPRASTPPWPTVTATAATGRTRDHRRRAPCSASPPARPPAGACAACANRACSCSSATAPRCPTSATSTRAASATSARTAAPKSLQSSRIARGERAPRGRRRRAPIEPRAQLTHRLYDRE
eukprot:364612-Chlamydomonas_euryale.AAC.23